MAGLHKTKTVMFIIMTVILSFVLFVIIVLLYISPGKLKPFNDPDGSSVEGSISEKIFVNIGGIRQGMFIRGRDIKNPVLLFIHGGPAFSEYFLVDKYPTGIEDYFTVCYWEERGGGLSYNPQVTAESMTLDQLASDAAEVTTYLRNRFGKDKIYVMAHSGGTAFALQTVARSPQFYSAYIGVAQITNQAESEKRAYEFMMGKYSDNGKPRLIEELRKYPVTDDENSLLPFFNSVIRDKAMHELGIGTMHNMRSVMKDIFLQVWLCRAYTLKEKINIWNSKLTFINKTHLREQVLKTDIPGLISKIDIPVYFMSGKYDLTVNRDLAMKYLEDIESPIKGFYTFENSAHSPMFEEPLRFKEILVKDVLNGTTTMADKYQR